MNAQAKDVAEATAATSKKKVTEYETVTAEDGAEEKFAGAREINRTWKYDADKGTITSRLAFRNGRVLEYTVKPEDTLDEIPAIARFAAHGMTQKRGDETAGAKTLDDAVAWVENLDDMLHEGKWSEGRAPGSGEAGGGLLAQAVFIMREAANKPLTMEKVREYLRTKTPKEKVQLRGNPKISVIIKRLNEEAGKASPEDAERLDSEIEALA
jgi:hypothetical protein